MRFPTPPDSKPPSPPSPPPLPARLAASPGSKRTEGARSAAAAAASSAPLGRSRISPGMGFVSFVGRVLFASVFLLSAYQEFSEFGVDGGPAAKAFGPKFDLVSGHLHTHLGLQAPEIEMKNVIAGTIALKGLGGLLFIFGSSLGATLLALYLALVTPIVYDFYNYDMEKPEFVQTFVKFTQSLALFGALLFFLGMKDSSPKRLAKKRGPKAKTT